MIDEKVIIPKTPKNPRNMALPKGVKSQVDYTKLYMSNELEGETISEKALSKKQQRFFGIVRAIQKGEQAPTTPETAKAAADMKKSDVKKFASTKHKGLPEKKVTKEELDKNDKPFVKKLLSNYVSLSKHMTNKQILLKRK